MEGGVGRGTGGGVCGFTSRREERRRAGVGPGAQGWKEWREKPASAFYDAGFIAQRIEDMHRVGLGKWSGGGDEGVGG